MKQITITLNEQEEADISNWVRFYLANPQYIGVPRPDGALPGPLPGGGYPWQTRIVLADMSRARFNELAKQFAPVVIQPPAKPVTPWPDGTFAGTMIAIDRLTKAGSQEREIDAPTSRVYAIPVELPAGPWAASRLSIAAAEYRDVPTVHIAWLSRVAGEFTPLGGQSSQGTSTLVSIDAAAEGLKPGDVVFWNVAHWSTDLNAITGGASQHMRVGGNVWPS